MSVWADLAGQDAAVAELQEAVAGDGLTHAWLFNGPPGCGRSTVAVAFAAALQCEQGGCGVCVSCHTVLAGTHADVERVSTSTLSHKVDDTRELVLRAARRPAVGRWQVVLIEDADRLTERAANALLKAVEEPPGSTVWLLCAPTVEDVLPTIRSRCRAVALRTPPIPAVADLLARRDGVDPAMAAFAARAAQGHVGRARRLATDEQARLRRAAVQRLPAALGTVEGCLLAAAELVDGAAEEAKAASAQLDEQETAALSRALGAGTTGRRPGLPAGAAAQLKELERAQKARAKRLQRDALDRALVDLAALYRDVLVVQLGASVELVHAELGPQLTRLARSGPPEQTLQHVEAVLACRTAVDANVAPLLAAEQMMLALAPVGATA